MEDRGSRLASSEKEGIVCPCIITSTSFPVLVLILCVASMFFLAPSCPSSPPSAVVAWTFSSVTLHAALVLLAETLARQQAVAVCCHRHVAPPCLSQASDDLHAELIKVDQIKAKASPHQCTSA